VVLGGDAGIDDGDAALAAALEMRDVETYGHSERVVRFSLRLGRGIGLGAGQLKATPWRL
jgi:HD-GYP domain-containing protein (c-di-GMP phosphodiesterase class II)